jgi:hypothetical protein
MVVDAIMALGAMLLGGLQKAWEAVSSAVNVIVEWLKQQIQKLLEPVVEPIWKGIQTYVEGIYNVICEVLEKPISDSEGADKLLRALFGESPSPFLMILGLSGVIHAIELLVLVFMVALGGGVSAGLITMIKQFIVRGIVTGIEKGWELAASATIGAAVGFIFSLLVPSNPVNTAYTAVGTTIMGFIVFTLQIAFSKKKITIGGIIGDIIGLSIAIVGFLITFYILQKVEWHIAEIITGVLGIVLTGIGLFIGLASQSILDDTPLGFLDELLSAGLFGFSIGSAIASATTS